MTAVDADRFGRLLRKVEGYADSAGWGGLPALYVVYNRTEASAAELYDRCMAQNPTLGPPVQVGPYAAQALVAGEWLCRQPGLEPWEAVTNLALNTAYATEPAAEKFRAIVMQPAVLGFAFRYEAFAADGRENLVNVVLGEFNHVADVPGSVEGRAVQGHDVQGRQYRVMRRRGHPVEMDCRGGWVGEFSTAMALLSDVVAGTVPPWEQFRTRYPTLKHLVLNGRRQPPAGQGETGIGHTAGCGS